jgi:hypothetical protein
VLELIKHVDSISALFPILSFLNFPFLPLLGLIVEMRDGSRSDGVFWRVGGRGLLLFRSASLPHTPSTELFAGLFLHLAIGVEFLFVGEPIREVDLFPFEICLHGGGVNGMVVFFSEVD